MRPFRSKFRKAVHREIRAVQSTDKLNSMLLGLHRKLNPPGEAEVAAAAHRQQNPAHDLKACALAFERRYAQRSGTTVDALHQCGQHVEPCSCGDDMCEGWAMGHTDAP